MSSSFSSSLPSIVVLISGSGTNLQALIDATASGKLKARITHVISNRKSAYGLTRAANANIPTTYHNLQTFSKTHPTSTKPGLMDGHSSSGHSSDDAARRAYDRELAQIIVGLKPDLVVCAGWMHIFSSATLDPLREAGIDIINLHPALPGCFTGKDAIGQAWEAYERGEVDKTGCMIHYVIEEVDLGEAITAREVQFWEGVTREALEERIHELEHDAIVEGAVKALEKRRSGV